MATGKTNAAGGIAFPSTPAAGDTPVHTILAASTSSSTSYAYAGTGFGFTAKKAGIFRVNIMALTRDSYTGYLKLQKNGVDVSGSEVSWTYGTTEKTIDVAVAANDQIKLFIKHTNVDSYSGYVRIHRFLVCILASDIQAAINSDVLTTL